MKYGYTSCIRKDTLCRIHYMKLLAIGYVDAKIIIIIIISK